jgi:carboxyl-terminal processing protease
LYNNSTFGRFAYDFYLKNQALLKTFKNPGDFIKGFSLNDENWKQFAETAAKDSIIINLVSANEKANLLTQIKSSIARQVWRSEGYFEVMNTNDEMIKKAMEIMQSK